MLVLLVGVAALAVWAFRQRTEAQKQARLANSGRLAAHVVNQVQDHHALALLLGVQASRLADTTESRGSLWQALQNAPLLQRHLHHRGEVASVAFSPDGRLIASGGKDGRVHLWSARGAPLGGAVDPHVGEVYQVGFSPDGRILAVSGTGERVIFLDTASLRPVRALPLKPGSWARCFSFHPAGNLLAIGLQGSVLLVDPASGQEVASFRTEGVDPPCPLSFSPDGKLLALVDSYEHLRLWEVGSRSFLGPSFTADREREDPWISSLAFSPDSRSLAFASRHGFRVWDLQGSPEAIQRLESPGRVDSLAFSPDGSKLLVGGTKGVQSWPLAELKEGKQRTFATSPLPSIALSPDGETLVAGESHGLSIWSLTASNPLIDVLRGGNVWHLSFSPDGRLLANAGISGVRVWSLGEKKLVAQPLQTWTARVAFGPDGDLLVIGEPNRGALLWSLRQGGLLGAPLPASGVNNLALSPDGGTLAEGSEELRLWSLRDRKPLGGPLSRTSSKELADVTFSPDGKLLAASDDDGVEVWSLPDRRRLRYLDEKQVTSVEIRPDGEVLATAGTPGVRLWSWRDPHQPLQETLTAQPSLLVAFSGDGQSIAAKIGGQIRLWWRSREDGRLATVELAELRDLAVGDLAFSPDGKKLALANGLMGTWVFNVDLDAWRRRACQAANRNLSLMEWERFVGPEVPYEKTCPDLPPGEGAPGR